MGSNKVSKETIFLITFKSYSGIANIISAIGILLIVIGFCCPVGSYNPTVMDEFKRNVKFDDLSIFGLLGVIAFMVVAVVMTAIVSSILRKPDWRTKAKRFFMLSIIAVVSIFVSFIILTIAVVFYEIPEAEFDYLDLENEAGYYLYLAGSIIYAAAFFLYCNILQRVAKGQLKLRDIAVFKNNVDTDLEPEESDNAPEESHT